MTLPVIIDQALLDALSAEAARHPRRRKNLNFHLGETDSCHRLLNAIEPGSYIPPHRHLDPAKDEAIVILRGRLGAVVFDEAGRVRETAVLCPGGGAVMLNVPHGTFHTVLALTSGTVFFEAKAGPYRPLTDGERAPWAPGEGEPGWEAWLNGLEALFGNTPG